MIIRATRLYVRLNEHGEWVEAPRTQYLITGAVESTLPSDPLPARSLDPAPPPATRSRTTAKLDPAVPKTGRRKRTRIQKFRKPLKTNDKRSFNRNKNTPSLEWPTEERLQSRRENLTIFVGRGFSHDKNAARSGGFSR
jgi:hypothetical protein